jgi:hypothetical protein
MFRPEQAGSGSARIGVLVWAWLGTGGEEIDSDGIPDSSFHNAATPPPKILPRISTFYAKSDIMETRTNERTNDGTANANWGPTTRRRSID